MLNEGIAELRCYDAFRWASSRQSQQQGLAITDSITVDGARGIRRSSLDVIGLPTQQELTVATTVEVVRITRTYNKDLNRYTGLKFLHNGERVLKRIGIRNSGRGGDRLWRSL